MANIEHSTITDPNIHEPKGIATATSGYVYIANGSGSGSWLNSNKITHVQFSNATHPTYTANVWSNTPLNTTVVNEVGATVNADTITLPAGTYQISAHTTYVLLTGSGTCLCRLYNATASSTLLAGMSASAGSGSPLGICVVDGKFTIGSSSNVALQVYPVTAPALNAVGSDAAHTNIVIRKIL